MARKPSIRGYQERDRLRMLRHQRLTDRRREFLQVINRLRKPGGRKLRPIQLKALNAFFTLEAPKGAFLPIGVGHGKTLIGLLAPAFCDAKRPLFLTKASLLGELERQREEWAGDYRLPDITLFNYEKLSLAKYKNFLEDLKPDLIILDEAHCLKNPKSARTKRFVRYIREHQDTRLIAMSGTMVRKGLRDYAHLAEISLREYCPLPVHYPTLARWASLLDVGTEPCHDDHLTFAQVFPEYLEETTTPSRARELYSTLFVNAPGVVATSDASVGATLIIDRDQQAPDHYREYVAKLEGGWALPCGQEICTASEYARAARTLSLGFYYKPEVGPELWQHARLMWGRSLRTITERNQQLDAPSLVEAAARAGTLLPQHQRNWEAWESLRGEFEPKSETVWLDTSLIIDKVKSVKRGLIWIYSKAVLRLLQEWGQVPVYASHEELDLRCPPPVAVVQIKGHSDGKNYQHAYDHNYIIEPPSSGSVWEQLLGRTHRQGQPSDEVTCTILQHTWPFIQAWRRAQNDARMIEETTRNRQKINFATKL